MLCTQADVQRILHRQQPRQPRENRLHHVSRAELQHSNMPDAETVRGTEVNEHEGCM